jgi:serine protease
MGWWDPSSDPDFNDEEVADLCVGFPPYLGYNANVTMGNGAYAMQTIWSNDTNACEILHPIIVADTVFANSFE